MSSYAKALEGVMRLFPKKITVTFEHVSGGVIGVCKIYEADLPEVFKRPLIIEALGRSWRVVGAEPRENKDFVYKRRLKLVVVEPEKAFEYVSEYFVATMAGHMPEVVDILPGDFEVLVGEEAWRQVEFLPASSMALVGEEVALIESILRPGKSVLRGYERRHVRDRVLPGSVTISLSEFCNVVESSALGALKFSDSGYVRDGFALRSAGFTYYGIVRNGMITDLCLEKFDCADLELFTVLSTFNLMMVDWCTGKIFTSEVKEVNDDVPAPGQTEIF